jgi:cyclopropane fatty-acyl-phospholipid synthase-like methyltransferase
LLRRIQFDLWYLLHPPWDTGISPPELLEFIATHPPGRALDLGCGTGTNVLTLAQHGWEASGIDFSSRAIRRAVSRLKAAGVSAQVLVGDVTRLQGLKGPYDLAVDIGCFHSLTRRSDYLVGLRRRLKPGAHWLMYGFLRSSPNGGEPGLDAEDVSSIASSGFHLVSQREGTDGGTRASAWFDYQAS